MVLSSAIFVGALALIASARVDRTKVAPIAGRPIGFVGFLKVGVPVALG